MHASSGSDLGRARGQRHVTLALAEDLVRQIVIMRLVPKAIIEHKHYQNCPTIHALFLPSLSRQVGLVSPGDEVVGLSYLRRIAPRVSRLLDSDNRSSDMRRLSGAEPVAACSDQDRHYSDTMPAHDMVMSLLRHAFSGGHWNLDGGPSVLGHAHLGVQDG